MSIFNTFQNDPAWVRIGPYLYNKQEGLLLVRDRDKLVYEYLRSLYREYKEAEPQMSRRHNELHEITGDMLEPDDDPTESDVWDGFGDDQNDALADSYDDGVRYSAEGFQIPPAHRNPTAEERLLADIWAEQQRSAADSFGRTTHDGK